MFDRLPRRDVVLLGAGHTNAHVLRMWRMAPIPDARLTVVSDFPVATYSGMLPGTLAGLYPPGRMQIDLVRLCAAAGARLICTQVEGLDVEGRRLLCADRPPIPFDVLSVGIGSRPRQPDGPIDSSVVPIKPMQTFLGRLEAALGEVFRRVPNRLRIAVVGAGAGGVEIAFCLPPRVRALWPVSDASLWPVSDRATTATEGLPAHGETFGQTAAGSETRAEQGTEPSQTRAGHLAPEILLIDSGDQILPGMPLGAQQLAEKELRRRGVQIHLGQAVLEVGGGVIVLADGSRLAADLVLWSTGAQPAELLSRLGLPHDEQGFLLTHPTLQTVANLPVFAVGDCGSIAGRSTPKAGVYAVRQGPVLWGNLHRQFAGQPLLEYRPQRGFLKILATGDRRAILTYKGLSFHAGWCWRVKNRIDSRFMDMYQDYSPMTAAWTEIVPREPSQQVRCAGCGGKVAGSVLSRVLNRLDVPRSEHVLLGLESPDDAAIVQAPGGRPIVTSVDFFTAFLDDPYLVGRVAALNAASDIFAKGARPLAALALATLPEGPEQKQEQLLFDLLSGSLHEFKQMGATLAGGHTIEGPHTAIGYSLLAEANGSPRTKNKLRAGDLLVLTKPLGSGVLLAAQMQARLRAEWLAPLLEALTTSNQPAAALAEEFEVAAVTDVTGFGLAGHMAEMLRASGLRAQLRLEEIALLPGARELFSEGVESTLAPANRQVEAEMHVDAALRTRPEFAALFDPQTSGGLLMGVPERHLDAILTRLGQLSNLHSRCVGQVLPADEEQPLIAVKV